ncbi:hypothetical protein [Ruegeria sp. Alg231-54]|uniref:hypothetical protein n=1 Tax=Ruegeria sp. Alg231-54 TaxID=1922221 RepID=UPI000D552B5D|nr:hypothetical protein [Ruegeria sp. Alg231-54]
MWKPIVFAFLTTCAGVTVALSHDVRDLATLHEPNIQDLSTTALKSAEGVEVIVSHVALPPNFTLPTHWHPGE